jgi:hypothetical protein
VAKAAGLFFMCHLHHARGAELTTAGTRLNSQERLIREGAMGLFFCLILFVVICLFGWSSRSTRAG